MSSAQRVPLTCGTHASTIAPRASGTRERAPVPSGAAGVKRSCRLQQNPIEPSAWDHPPLGITLRVKIPIGHIVQRWDTSAGGFEQQPDVVVDIAFLAMHLR